MSDDRCVVVITYVGPEKDHYCVVRCHRPELEDGRFFQAVSRGNVFKDEETAMECAEQLLKDTEYGLIKFSVRFDIRP